MRKGNDKTNYRRVLNQRQNSGDRSKSKSKYVDLPKLREKVKKIEVEIKKLTDVVQALVDEKIVEKLVLQSQWKIWEYD